MDRLNCIGDVAIRGLVVAMTGDVKSVEELLDSVSAKMSACHAIRTQQLDGYIRMFKPDDWDKWSYARRRRWIDFFNDAFDEEVAKQ